MHVSHGKVSMPYKNFLGYRKGENGEPEIVPEEAEVVRRMSSCATTSGRSLYSQVSRIAYRMNDPPQFVKCGGKTPQTESRRRQAARSGKGPDE